MLIDIDMLIHCNQLDSKLINNLYCSGLISYDTILFCFYNNRVYIFRSLTEDGWKAEVLYMQITWFQVIYDVSNA